MHICKLDHAALLVKDVERTRPCSPTKFAFSIAWWRGDGTMAQALIRRKSRQNHCLSWSSLWDFPSR